MYGNKNPYKPVINSRLFELGIVDLGGDSVNKRSMDQTC